MGADIVFTPLHASAKVTFCQVMLAFWPRISCTQWVIYTSQRANPGNAMNPEIEFGVNVVFCSDVMNYI
jgi:hypothetical protein